MAYEFSVTRVTMSGLCFGGNEQWSTSFYVGYEDSGASNPTQQAVDDIAARWTTFFQAANSSIANDYTTTQVKMAQLNADGSTMLDNVVFHTYTTQPVGANASALMAPQVALAAQLRSSLSRGFASKGRMYLPGVNVAVDNTGHLTTGGPANIAGTLKTFFDGVNTDLGIAGSVILASFGRTLPTPATGVNKEVTAVAVGNVYDTQRRRRNALVETYSVTTLA